MQMSLVCVMMNTSHIKALSNKKGADTMKEKRRDIKGRILHTGESQRTDGKYLYKYVDAFGNTKYVYAWRLTPTDPTPKGKREKPSLRELEQQIRRDIEDGIDSTGKKMTLCQLYAKQNAQRANVKKSTIKQREQLMRLLTLINLILYVRSMRISRVRLHTQTIRLL